MLFVFIFDKLMVIHYRYRVQTLFKLCKKILAIYGAV